MNPYYHILGLEPDASQVEIKKAYFKLIRQHTPENDPEQFQQIREAYEHLKNAKNEPESPTFPAPSEPLAVKMLEQIILYGRQKNDKLCRDACEEAWRRFPNELQFLYLLVIAQRQCGNTGKAVKNAELLVSKAPDNKWFHKELAISYMERGFTKKAYKACDKAYSLGCRDLDFVLMYAESCISDNQYDKGIAILLEIIHRDTRWTKDEMPELTEAYLMLLDMNYHSRKNYLLEILENFYSFIERYNIYLKEYASDYALALAHLCAKAKPNSKEYQKTDQLFVLLHQTCSTDDERHDVDIFTEEFHYQCFMNDTRFGDTLFRYMEIFHDLANVDETYQRFAKTDTQLCMIEEQERILQQADIMKQDYPDLYEYIKDFIQKLESSKNLTILKDSLLKTYRRIQPYFSGGYYYEYYPQEKIHAFGTIINEDVDKPYVRSSKKIGRNDPCPCGSGKKYKHCCMNK